MSTNTQKLSLKEKLGYGFGDLASVLYWQTFMLYFTYFYTDVFLIPAGLAAAMFLVSRIWDGVNDPMMGILADRTNTKWGKFRPYLLWLCVPFAIAGVLAFTVPSFGITGKIIWAYSTFILIMMLYTAINIPYTSLLGVISADSNERTSVSSVKFMFAFSAGIIISATLLPLTKTLGRGNTSIIQAEIKNHIITLGEKETGAARIELTAEDQEGNVGKIEFPVRVDPAESNLPVLNAPIDDIFLEEGFKAYEIDISAVFTSKGKEALMYTLPNKKEGLLSKLKEKDIKKDAVGAEIIDDKLLITENSIGNTKITVTAKDKKWGEKSHSFFVNVYKKGNRNPVISDSTDFIQLESGFEKKEVDLSEIIKDPDRDTLTFTAESNNPQILTPEIDKNKLTFLENKSGIAELYITATDSKGGQLKHTLKFLIALKGNNPPYINKTVDNIFTYAGFKSQEIDVSDVFVDPDGKPLKYKVEVINDAKGWQRTFIIIGIAAILFFFIAFKSTRERVKPSKSQKTSIRKDLYNLVTNRPWLLLLATTITFILFVAVRSSVTVHYFKYFIGTKDIHLPFLGSKVYDFETLASAFNTIGQISSFLGVLIVAWFAKLVGKKKAFIVIFIIAIFSTGIVYFMSAAQLGLIFFFQITGSMTGGPLSVLLWAMYADTADYGEWSRDTRSTGLIFSASTMSQKFGWAFGAFVALNLMSQVGFQPNETQSSESLHGLVALFTLIPAAIGILSVIISLFYPLHDKRVAEISNELAERRKQRGEEIN